MILRSQRGFSLVELMIVVAIIGILAAVAIPNFARFQAKARQSEAKADLSAIYTAEKAFYQEWQQYFADFGEIGYFPEGSFRYNHGFAASVPLSPPSYTGALGQGIAANVISTANCGASMTTRVDPGFTNPPPGYMGCGVELAPASGANVALASGTVDTTSSFLAEAVGDIDSDVGADFWVMDQSKGIGGPYNAAAANAAVAPNGGDLDN